MEKKKIFDVISLGSAIVDVIAYKSEAFLEKAGMVKGSMKLVSFKECKDLYEKFVAATECSGGSAANTAASLAMLGAKSGFVGKVKSDYDGKLFIGDIEKVGVKFLTEKTDIGLSTPKCIIIVTEEEISPNHKVVERTMATYLDPEVAISEDDITKEMIESTEIIFFESYLLDNPKARAALTKAINIALEVGTKISFTLSDPFCVERHREYIEDLVFNKANLVFANEKETLSLFGGDDYRKVLDKISSLKTTFCLTRGENGSVITEGGNIYTVDAVKTDDVYDVTGAGDTFAAGYIYGYINNFGVEKSARLGAFCATEVIKYIGARPVKDLKSILELV